MAALVRKLQRVLLNTSTACYNPFIKIQLRMYCSTIHPELDCFYVLIILKVLRIHPQLAANEIGVAVAARKSLPVSVHMQTITITLHYLTYEESVQYIEKTTTLLPKRIRDLANKINGLPLKPSVSSGHAYKEYKS